MVTKLDRLARSVADAHDITKDLTARGVRLNLGGSVHDPTDPVGKPLFTALGELISASLRPMLLKGRPPDGR